MHAYLENMRESVSSLELVLHRTPTPNLKALTKMNEVEDKLHGIVEGKTCHTDSQWHMLAPYVCALDIKEQLLVNY